MIAQRRIEQVDGSVYTAYRARMADTTTVRIDRTTHEQLRRLAAQRDSTVTETVARAVRLLVQEQMGQQLAAPLTREETDWLDADLG